MIRAGTCFCHRCGNIFQTAYYKHGGKAVGAVLKRHAFALGKKRWTIEPFRPDGGTITLEDSPFLARVSDEKEGIPNTIWCTFGPEGKTEYELKRCCPKCRTEDTVLVSDCGRYPTYVVAMVGATMVGKSAWLRAIATNSNLNAVNSVTEYPYELDFVEKYPADDWELAATAKDSAGATNYLKIKERGSGKTVALVIFLDAAGELFQSVTQEDNTQRKFLLGNGDYSGVDAVICVESAEQAVNPLKTEEDRVRYSNSFRVFNEMGKAGALENKPVACIYPKTDLVLKQKSKIPMVEDMTGQRKVPLFTQSTFRGKTSYAPKDLIPRLAQEDLIARSINTTVLQTTAKNRHGFMIQTCSQEFMSDGKLWNVYRDNFNVMDPLLWILHSLQLYPIPNK